MLQECYKAFKCSEKVQLFTKPPASEEKRTELARETLEILERGC